METLRRTGATEVIQFVFRIARSRWIVVVAAIWIQCCSGSSYNFGIYSGAVKTALDYDQAALNTLATFKDLGSNFGIFSGFVFDYFTPAGVLTIGALQSGFGYLMVWLSITRRIAPPQFWQMCVYTFLAANGQTYFNTACVVTCVKHFPNNRGIIIGLLKGFLGLSGAILTQFFHAIFPEDQGSSFLILVTCAPSLMALFLMPFVRPVSDTENGQPQPRNENTNLYLMSSIAVALAGYLMVAIVVENLLSINHVAFVTICACICGILSLPIGVAVRSELQEMKMRLSCSYSSLQQPLLIDDHVSEEGNDNLKIKRGNEALIEHVRTLVPGDISDPEVDDEAGLPAFLQSRGKAHLDLGEEAQCDDDDDDQYKSLPNLRTSSEASTSHSYLPNLPGKLDDCALNLPTEVPLRRRRAPRRGEDHTVVQALCKADFWLLFMGLMCGMGSGLTAIDNLGQIGASLGYTTDKIGTFISLLSIWNFSGRLGMGALSEFCLKRFKLGRSVVLVFSQLAMCLAHLWLSSGASGSLYVGSIVIGFCYGAQWSVTPAIISELFGLKRFATLFNICTVASPIGVYFFSVQIAGRLYDFEAEKQNVSQGHFRMFRWFNSALGLEAECIGPLCYRLTFLILAVVSLLGSMFYLLLARRTTLFYSREIFSTSPTDSTMEKRQESCTAYEESAVDSQSTVRSQSQC